MTKQIVISAPIPPELAARLHAWVSTNGKPTSNAAVVRAALTEWLDRYASLTAKGPDFVGWHWVFEPKRRIKPAGRDASRGRRRPATGP